jgi:type II secretory pathway pseudopilin PulG
MTGSSGVSLLDSLVALALVGLGLAVALPNLASFRAQASLESVARQLVADAIRCRATAMAQRRSVALVFGQEGGSSFYGVVVDGDGDGVLHRDIARGTDRQVGPRILIDELCRGARLGVPAGWRVPNPSGRGQLRPGDGVRAGRANMVSFSPLGDATPATVYVTDGRERLLAVRIYGGTARVRVLEWRRGWSSWRRLPL